MSKKNKNSMLDNMKYEVAEENHINLKDGYNGDLKAREAGKIGGQMVKRMIKFAEENMPEDYH